MELSPARWRSALSRTTLALVATSLLVGASIMGTATQAEAAPTTTFSATAPTGITRIDNDSAVELGLRFVPSTNGTVTAVRFYKANADRKSTPISVSLWSTSGQRLTSAAVTSTSSTGWITVNLKSPVALSAKQEYIVSQHAINGSYVATRHYFAGAKTSSYLAMPKDAGVFKYDTRSRFPNETYQSSNYWIDPVFEPSAAKPTPTATPTTTPTAKPTATPTTTPTAKPTATPTTPVKPSTAPTTAPSTGLMGWELNAKNVGLAPLGLSCDSLPLYTGSMTPAAGTRISGVRIVGQLDLRNGDIVVERSCIRPAAGAGAPSGTSALVSNFVCGQDECPVISAKSITIRDSEFDASAVPASQIAATCAFRGTATLERNYMHGMGSGICFYGTGLKHDAIAEQNFVTDLRSYGESHNEAATVRDFMLNENPNRVARFTRNRFSIAEGNVTAGLFIQPTWDNIDTILVEGNLIEGGGYNLFLNKAHGNYSNARAVNNRFVSTGWGPSTVQGGSGWSQWKDNYRYDASKTAGQGAAVAAS